MTRKAAFAAAALLLATLPAHAADKVRAAKAVGSQWVFTVLDVGMEQGIFAKYGIDVEISAMTGEARMQQALTAGSLDVGLAGSSGAALSVKGAPVLAVAVFLNQPANFAVVVLNDSPIKSVADLKGKSISGATTGGLPEWLVKHLAVTQGWGPDGIRSVSVGSPDASVSAMRTHQVDGMMTANTVGFTLEQQNIAHIIVHIGDYAKDYHSALVFARKGFIDETPDVADRFLKGMFATIAFMRTNKERSVEIAANVMHLDRAILDRVYDIEIGAFSTDGHFDPQAVELVKQSFVDMGSLPEKPRDDQILTTKFVPVKF
ncbi:MAG TPA: ABC transporter substrate-binding protein [Stellaceae bacterium]|nr:ABC transporter substrate-binding protein [Stellaceae bacterium]